MRKLLKRIGAYMIDIILISTIATLISQTPLNPNYEKIEKINLKYQEVYKYYTDAITDLNELFETEEELDKKVEDFENNYPEYRLEIKKNYNDKEFDKDEKSKLLTLVANDFDAKYKVFFYDMRKLSIYQDVFSLILIILYFVGFAYIMNGETLGKKIMKIRIVSNNDKKLSIINYLLRSLLINGIIITFIDLLLLFSLKEKVYIEAYNYVYIISYVLELAIIFTTYINKENRGIHDLLANTKVIDINPKDINLASTITDNGKEIENLEVRDTRETKKRKRNK